MMNDRRGSGQADDEVDPGLCGTCVHASVVVSSRGARFYFCRLSRTDPRFARYPRLPVVACPGYRAGESILSEAKNSEGG
jgi:hypothetical protein